MGGIRSFPVLGSARLGNRKDSPSSGGDPHLTPFTPLLEVKEKRFHQDEAILINYEVDYKYL
jgi:hypothetical protein